MSDRASHADDEAMLLHYRELYESDKETDFRIHSIDADGGVKTFSVHKAVLLRSKYFEAACGGGNWAESQNNEMTLPEEGKTVEAIVRHLYGYHKAKVMGSIELDDRFEDITMIYIAAEKYLLPDLMTTAAKTWGDFFENDHFEFTELAAYSYACSDNEDEVERAQELIRALLCLEDHGDMKLQHLWDQATSKMEGWEGFKRLIVSVRQAIFAEVPRVVKSWAKAALTQEQGDAENSQDNAENSDHRAEDSEDGARDCDDDAGDSDPNSQKSEESNECGAMCPACGKQWTMRISRAKAMADTSIFCPHCGVKNAFEDCMIELAIASSDEVEAEGADWHTPLCKWANRVGIGGEGGHCDAE